MATNQKHDCVEPTLESTFARPTRAGLRARLAGPPQRVPGTPRRTIFFVIAAAAALIGFTTGRTLYARASDVPTAPRAPATASPVAAPAFSPATAPAVSPAVSAPTPPPVNECGGPHSLLAPLPARVSEAPAGGIAGWGPRPVTRPTAPRRLRTAQASASVVAQRAAPLALPPAAAAAAPLPTATRMRDLENVTRELASAL